MKNYYSILGVASTATAETIKKAYRKLAKENHPDVNPGDRVAEEKFKTVGEAYAILGDEKKRAAYDKTRVKSRRTSATSSRKRTTPVGAVDFEEMMRNFSESFSSDSIKTEAENTTVKKDPFHSEELFRKFMGFK